MAFTDLTAIATRAVARSALGYDENTSTAVITGARTAVPAEAALLATPERWPKQRCEIWGAEHFDASTFDSNAFHRMY
jgi:hypothetical protein